MDLTTADLESMGIADPQSRADILHLLRIVESLDSRTLSC